MRKEIGQGEVCVSRKMDEAKKTYEAPKLVQLGSVSELTRTEFSGS